MARRPTTPIIQYKLANGEKRFKFNTYLGVNPLTGKDMRTTRCGFKSKKEAELALARLKLEVSNGTYKKTTVETYKEVYEVWMEQYEKRVESSTLLKTVRMFENHILPAYGNFRVEKMTIEVCQLPVDKWAAKLDCAIRMKSYASMVMKFAIKRGYIQSNPFDHVEVIKPKKPFSESEEVKENFYSRRELIEFLDYAEAEGDDKVFAYFRLLAFTGMRRGEAFALRWKDVDFRNKEIKVSKSLSRGLTEERHSEGKRKGELKTDRYIKGTKNGESRILNLDEQTLSVLKVWRAKQRKELLMLGINALGSDQLLFSNHKNGYICTTLSRRWLLRIQEKYGLKKITTHGFRHTHCSLLFEAGANLKEVQERLGHKDSSVTLDIYAHATKEAKVEAVTKFEEFMSV